MTTLQNLASLQKDPWERIQISVDLAEAARRLDNEFFRDADVAQVADAARRYRKFLLLSRLLPGVPLAPTKDIDEMWHIHMLHPVAYYEDCMANFGAILDHDGGFGSASFEEWQQLERLFEMTSRLWQEVFGEPYTDGEISEGMRRCIKACARCATRCRTACKKR
ncbi:MAG: hypothetical protein KatS3mg110_1303 [Pirellulaceae bacterium]|nr:MAG: hypothetical protein KatS3mg110_1303 [Pirellulaceae bacterium]